MTEIWDSMTDTLKLVATWKMSLLLCYEIFEGVSMTAIMT